MTLAPLGLAAETHNPVFFDLDLKRQLLFAVLDLFSHIAGFISGRGSAENFPKTYASFIGQPEGVNRKIRLLWIGCGAEDGAFAASKAFSEFLNKHNIKHTFRESGGAHTCTV